jgi:hypothetical protein
VLTLSSSFSVNLKCWEKKKRSLLKILNLEPRDVRTRGVHTVQSTKPQGKSRASQWCSQSHPSPSHPCSHWPHYPLTQPRNPQVSWLGNIGSTPPGVLPYNSLTPKFLTSSTHLPHGPSPITLSLSLWPCCSSPYLPSLPHATVRKDFQNDKLSQIT